MLLFWISCGVLTVGVILALASPLLGGRRDDREAADASASARSIYRDQLAEIETDKAQGLISGVEAEAARAEVARRLLAITAGAPELPGTDTRGAPASRGAARHGWYYAIAALVPAVALPIYLALGSPGLPSRPAADRLAAAPDANMRIAELIARAEAQLRANPRDGRGWDVIAPVYLRTGRFREAADAFQRAIDLLGATPNRLSGLAESTVLANDGIVTEPARSAYARLLEAEPGRTEARFGLAMAMEQDGALEKAAQAYRQLLKEAPPDAPWRQYVQERLDAVIRKMGPGEDQTTPSSQADTFDTLAKLPEGERKQAILGMVEGLAARLKSDGSDVTGWQRLMTSWSVLGQPDKAEAALRDARKALADNQAALAQINDFARKLGLKS